MLYCCSLAGPSLPCVEISIRPLAAGLCPSLRGAVKSPALSRCGIPLLQALFFYLLFALEPLVFIKKSASCFACSGDPVTPRYNSSLLYHKDQSFALTVKFSYRRTQGHAKQRSAPHANSRLCSYLRLSNGWLVVGI